MYRIIPADLDQPAHQTGLLRCLDDYAKDPMGGGVALAPEVKSRVIAGLKAQPGNVNFLAMHGDDAVGVAVCFMGYSTFRGQPRLNVHDLAVSPAHRGHGLGRRLLEAVSEHAKAADCCAVTLEVLRHNEVARKLYQSQGFGDSAGGMDFWVQSL